MRIDGSLYVSISVLQIKKRTRPFSSITEEVTKVHLREAATCEKSPKKRKETNAKGKNKTQTKERKRKSRKGAQI
ncbi:hypothetical protein KOW79_006764 [Hemibagrus wyckioides]|uniref:Uncharacterized protein n=1 Tax=Hemibagrus wyckioides TaxID=337641 RepID=A0A9D3P114_9TELE|nr:hypothetical protein KOW79_006764 [Hemibagrus wyckioides]